MNKVYGFKANPVYCCIDVEASEQESVCIQKKLVDGTPIFNKDGSPKYLEDSEGNPLHPVLVYSCVAMLYDSRVQVEQEYVSPADDNDRAEAKKHGYELERDENGIEIIRTKRIVHKCIAKYHFRDVIQIVRFLQDLSKKAEDSGYCKPKRRKDATDEIAPIRVYAHNLSYEIMSIGRVAFNQKGLEYKEKGSICTSSTEVLSMVLGNIELRDTLKLFVKGIGGLGKDFKVYKLDGDESYRANQTPETHITDEMWRYNERDVEIIAIALTNLMNSKTWIDTIDDIPLTSTGIGRENNKYDTSINVEEEYEYEEKVVYRSGKSKGQPKLDKDGKQIVKKVVKKTTLRQQYQRRCGFHYPRSIAELTTAMNTYIGGFVYSNAGVCCQHLKDVISVDVASLYPAVAITMLFREKRLYNGRFLTGTEADGVFRDIVFDRRNANFHKCPINDRPYYQKKGFDGYFIFKNLRAKKFNTTAGGFVPSMRWGTSIRHMGLASVIGLQNEMCNLDGKTGNNNGKIMDASVIQLALDEDTFYCLQLCYDFDEVECTGAYFWSLARPHRYTHNLFTIYGVAKKIVKELVTYMESTGKMPEEDSELLKNALDAGMSTLTPAQFCSMPYDDAFKWSKDLLQSIKALLNGQYGINVEGLIKDQFSPDECFTRIVKNNQIKALRYCVNYALAENEGERFNHDSFIDELTKELLLTVNEKDRANLDYDSCRERIKNADKIKIADWICERCSSKAITTWKRKDKTPVYKSVLESSLKLIYFEAGFHSTQARNICRSFYDGKKIANGAKIYTCVYACYVCKNGASVDYIDTDSVKFHGISFEKSEEIRKVFNSRIYELRETLFPNTEFIRGSSIQYRQAHQLNFGDMELEHVFTDFSTMGNKNYCGVYTVKDKKTGDEKVIRKWTVSGIPDADSKFNKLLDLKCKGDFDVWLKKYYHFGLTFTADCSGKWNKKKGKFDSALMHYLTSEIFEYTNSDGSSFKYFSAPVLRPMSKSVNRALGEERNQADNRLGILLRYIENIGNTVNTKETVVNSKTFGI